MRLDMGPAILFCPGDRPDRFAKAAARADAVILDLEDAVAPAAKAAARDAIVAAGDGPDALDPASTMVRVNASSASEELDLDLEAVRRSPFRTVMLAKTESSAEVDALVSRIEGLHVVALVETAMGVVHAAEIAAHPAVVGLMWGAEDLIASMGGTSSRDADGAYRAVVMHARSTVLLAAAAHDRAAIDSIWVDIPDIEGIAAEALDAAASGFSAKASIHPSHAAPIRTAFAPTGADADWADRVLAAADGAPGVFAFEGRMVDEPILRHARSVRSRAAAASAATAAVNRTESS